MRTRPKRPYKTLADYLVIGVSPVLVMLLVGSLNFFLVQVFYRGEAVGSVRWVLFWFVFGVVLVSRIGVEQNAGYSAGYGLALAAATWLYLAHVHPAWLLGVVLLGTVWWCANRLTRDCTLIDEDEDASGFGLLQGRARNEGRREKGEVRAGNGAAEDASGPAKPPPMKPAREAARKKSPPPDEAETRRKPPHAPGKWVVYFSLAALPLFGIGQMLLPAGDAEARRHGFTLLFIYLATALALLITTSLLGLRRYLRQRFLPMPAAIAFGWIRWGVVVAAIVLAVALLLPRPGAGEAWMNLRYRIDYQLRRASEFAQRFNPHGSGEGRPGDQAKPGDRDEHGVAENGGERETNTGNDPNAQQRRPGGTQPNRDTPSQPHVEAPSRGGAASGWYRVLRFLFLLVVAVLLCWGMIRYRHLLARLVRSFLEAVAQFLKNLFGFHLPWPRGSRKNVVESRRPRPFAAYENPFVTGNDNSWSREELILYSYEAVQAWAGERGAALEPHQTAREFCGALSERFPEVGFELGRLAFLHGHAAYAGSAPEPCDLEPLRQLWSFVSAPLAEVPIE